MAAITEIHLPRSNSLAARLSVFFAGVAEAQEKRALYRRTLRELSQLSARELADLGMNRSQIRRAALETAYDL